MIGFKRINTIDSLLYFDYKEVRIAQAMITNSRQVLLPANKFKLGRQAMIRVNNIRQADEFFITLSHVNSTKKINEIPKENNVNLHHS
jgi:DeoR family glycerol-3-phosphate regulon repressor